MSSTVLTIWFLTVLLDTAGQLAFKAVAIDPNAGEGTGRWRHMAANPRMWLGISCYLFEFLAWVAFLSLVPLGRGVLLGSINIVVVMVAGRMLFKERLNPSHVIGILLISGGVAVVGLGT
ncbi:MAG: EamA family transporter [Xanthomonadaceae bacterium]|jgi:drug/metabolite transporter (DMT)-like permease|nr:EamA family transporter [Xanthomonadaceae bacterium]